MLHRSSLVAMAALLGACASAVTNEDGGSDVRHDTLRDVPPVEVFDAPGVDVPDVDAAGADAPGFDVPVLGDVSSADTPAGSEAAADVLPTDGSCSFPISGDGGSCLRLQSCDGNPFCAAQIVNDTTHPSFFVTQFDFQAPPSLAGTSIRHVVNGAIANGELSIGLALDIAAGSLRVGGFQQGVMPVSGEGFFTSAFSFYAGGAPPPGSATRWDPATTTFTLVGETFSSGIVASVVFPLYQSDGSLLMELPFRNARIHDAQLNSGRDCIGFALSPFNSCVDGRWATTDTLTATPYAVFEGDIAVADAENTPILPLATTLCDLISGSNCATTPQSMWVQQPDAAIGGSSTPNAWHARANLGAVAIMIH